MVETFKIAIAMYVLDCASSDYLVSAANEMLNDSIYSDSLADLALTTSPIMSDIGPIFEKALAELGIGIPPSNDAFLILIQHYLTKIASESTDPEDGIFSLYSSICVRFNELREFNEEFARWFESVLSNYNDIGAGELPECIKPDIDKEAVVNAKHWLEIFI